MHTSRFIATLVLGCFMMQALSASLPVHAAESSLDLSEQAPIGTETASRQENTTATSVPVETSTPVQAPVESGPKTVASPAVKPDERGNDAKGKGEEVLLSAPLSAASGQASFPSSSSRKTKLPQSDGVSGALTYGYPLTIPPGRNGMAPALALSYNSQGNEEGSLFGSGWSLSVPFIERQNKTGTDKLYASAAFTSSFSGELVAVNAATYRAKVENGEFLQYSFVNNTWTVKDKQGKIYVFGAQSSTRQDSAADPPKAFRWMLEKVTDTNGNVVTYEYFKDAGQIYPNKITYTHNGASVGPFAVEFMRQSRPDTATSYRTGFVVKTNYRISEIVVKTNGTWTRKYVLSYGTGTNGGRTLLDKITETGMDQASGTQTSLPPVDFDYLSPASSWSTNAAWQSPEDFLDLSLKDRGVRVTDVNGDGLQDILYSRLSSVPNNQGDPVHEKKTYLNNGSGWTLQTSGWDIPIPFVSEAGNDKGAQVTDINGDLLPDIIQYFVGWPGETIEKKTYLNNGSGWTLQATGWNAPNPFMWYGQDRGTRLSDLNGDGLVDMFWSMRTGYDAQGNEMHDKHVYLNTGTDWVEDPAWIIPLAFTDTYAQAKGVRIADINNDGLADILQHWRYNYGGNNVDAKAVYLNNGGGWTLQTSGWNLPQPFQYSTYDFGTRFADINGDDLPDIVHARMTGYDAQDNEVVEKHVYLNTGTTWVETWNWTIPTHFVNSQYQDLGVQVTDLDGDGLTDFAKKRIIRYDAQGVPIYDQSIHIATGSKSDTLSKVTTSHGAIASIAYESSAKFKNGSLLANPALPFLLQTVKAITVNNGLGTAATDSFFYEAGRYSFTSATDRKFAGFGKVTKTDPTGDKSVTYYHQGDASNTGQGEYQDHMSKIGRPYRSEVRNANGTMFLATVSKWNRTDLGNGASFVFAAQTLTQDYDGGAMHKDVATSYAYDAWGNVTQEKNWGEVTGNADGTFTDVIDRIMVKNVSYASGTDVKSSPCVVSMRDGGNILLSEQRLYYDALALCQVGKGNPTKTERLLIGSGYYAATIGYNAYGQPVTQTDWKGNVTTTSYDSASIYPATVTNPLGHVVSTVIDVATGQIKEVSDPNGAKTKNTFDGLGRIIKVEMTDPTAPPALKVAQTATYDDAARPVRATLKKFNGVVTDPGVEEISYMDGLGNALQTRTTAEGTNQYFVATKTYDSEFRPLKETLPVFQTGSAYVAPSAADKGNQFAYDTLDRIVSITNALGTTSTAYTPWKKEVTDMNGHKKRVYADAYGTMIKTEEVNGASTYTTLYDYDAANRLAKITDAEGNIRTFTYDSLGRLLSQDMLHHPSQAATTYGSWSLTYDANDNVVTKKDPKNQTVTFTYDALNRLKTEDFTGQTGVETTMAYDTGTYGKGRLASAVSQGVTTAYTYDILGRTTGTTWTADAVTRTQTTAYDLLGNVKSVAYPNAKTVTTTFNNAYFVETIKEGTNTLVSGVEYVPTGAVKKVDFGNGTSTVNTHDISKLYRLTNKTTTKGSTVHQNVAYTYDAVGNVKKIVESAITNAKRTVDYAYDDLDRLLSANTTGVATGQPMGLQTFTYSATGNLLSSGLGSYLYEKTNSANPQAVTKVGTNRTYVYDKNGNLTSSSIAGVANIYTYDFRDRMIKSKKGTAPDVVYQYDHEFARLKKWDKNGNKIILYFGDFEIEGTGDTTGKLTTTTLSRINVGLGQGQSVSLEYNSSGTLTTRAFHHTDHLSGASIETDANGNLLQTLDYHPYGAVRVNTKATTYDNRKKFTGKELDPESSLTSFGARYYDAEIGRWMGYDPIQHDPSLLLKTMELNGYAYVKNNPLTGIDSDGLLTIMIHGTDLDGDGPGGRQAYKTPEGEAHTLRVGLTFNETPLQFKWSGGNTSEARTQAAQDLASKINNHSFADGEKLNIVAHSHGGNIALETTHLINRIVDNLVTMGTPVRNDYEAKSGMVANHIQVFSYRDEVQSWGGYNSSKKYIGSKEMNGETITERFWDQASCRSGGFSCKAAFEFGNAGRKFGEAKNINATGYTSFMNWKQVHSDLWQKASIWTLVSRRLR